MICLNASALSSNSLSVPFSFVSDYGRFLSSKGNAPGFQNVSDSRGNVPSSKIFPSSASPRSAHVAAALPKGTYPALVDSGSSDCFVDSSFVNQNRLETYSVDPLQLRLFDGTTNNLITQAINLPLRFPSGVVILSTFYVTPLDGTCVLVLGHNWLTRNNPSIDWVLGSITFRTPTQTHLEPISASAEPLDSNPSVSIPSVDTANIR